MDKIKKNKEFIIRYFNVMSGVVKTEELSREYMTDEHLIEHINFFEAAFPKYELFIDELIAEEDKVLVRARLKGCQTGEFNGLPPTGKTIDLPFVIRYTVKGNFIVDHWLIADQFLMMEQLGINQAKEKQPV